MTENKITLTNEEKNRLKNAYPYLQKGDWDMAFDKISNTGLDKIGGNEPLHILEFLKENGIDLWHKITYLPDSAFVLCDELEEIIIPSNIKAICDDAFNGCISLNKLIIPNTVKSIGEGFVRHCADLMVIRFNGTKEEWGKINKNKDWGDMWIKLRVKAPSIKCLDGDIQL